MKKSILSVAVATTFLASCSENSMMDVQYDIPNSIGVNAASGTTKATDLTALVAEGANLDIYVADGHGRDNVAISFANNGSGVYGDSELTWKEITGLNTGVEFFSLVNGETSLVLEPGETDATFSSGIDQSTNGSNQKDLMFYAGRLSSIPSNGKIPALFSHATSKTNVFANLLNKADEAVVAGVKYKNFSTKGTPTLFVSDQGLGQISWVVSGEAANYSDYAYKACVAGEESTVVSTEEAPNFRLGTSDAYILPQGLQGPTVTNGTIATPAELGTHDYIEVVYRLSSGEAPVVGFETKAEYDAACTAANVTPSELATEDKFPLYAKVAFPFSSAEGTTLAYNTQYNFNVSLPGGYLVGENFVDENGNDTEIPVIRPSDGGEVNPGQPVVPSADALIGVGVTMGDWNEDSTNVDM